jgi:heme exporter protein A
MMLRLRKVSKVFGVRPVLKNVSFDLDAGRVMLVVGPNGAGKSTLMKIAAGLSQPTFGEVEHGVGPEGIGYLGHATFIYPGLTALQNLAFWAKLFKISRDEKTLLAVLTRVGLKAAAHEPARSFSRGMAQRLSLARVLLMEPKLLFLDEPGTGLDEASLKILHDEIAAAKARGAAIMWVSHDVRGDLARADQVLSLEDRKKPACLPAAEYTAPALMGACP